jgi:ferrous iron transport protein B
MAQLLTRLKSLQTTSDAGCHGGMQENTNGLPLIAIVGTPNVGKSVLFNTLTGAYVTVSNYPGTTVEVSRGTGRLGGAQVGVVDTPGMYRLMPLTDEERVARDILLVEKPDLVIHVTDAKNLERMLPMTLQLIEAGLRVILVANLMDEARRLGVQVDTQRLEAELGIPVIGTALTLGQGTTELKNLLASSLGPSTCCHTPKPHPGPIRYHTQIETALKEIETNLQGEYQISKRAIGLLLLQNDSGVTDLVASVEADRFVGIKTILDGISQKFSQPLTYLITLQQRDVAQKILTEAIYYPEERLSGFAERLSQAMMNPLAGIPILLLTLYLMYEFVGVLGAQTLVDFLEGVVFGQYINPWVDRLLVSYIPWQVLRDLIGGEYGLITLGIRYAVALILPIVGTFFLVFSVIEDSGYLPRLAMLIDKVFKRIGLNGRAVIPMVLGFGCDTMATIVTRTLETRRERLLSTFLLALAIPCSAQLGVMLGLLSGNIAMLVIWASIVLAVFLLVGLLAAKLVPGERPTFYMELPPLRLPTLTNILVKTYTRLEWYFREVLPVFLLASVIIWLGKLTGLFDVAVGLLQPLVRWMGLPDQTAVAFLFGFFRRDYGAAGLYDLRNAMTNTQLLIATVTMTLFIPCVAQFSVMLKERGWKTALGIVIFIFPFAFLVGGLLNWLLTILPIGL